MKNVEMSHTFAITTDIAGNQEHPELIEMLRDYQDVFEEPNGLPPERGIEHQITLKENSIPKHQYPYRASYSQKDVIKKIVNEMLQTGIIRNSQRPFTSPMIMVKKKDGTWRLCVDYRYVNNLTIKHDYPIPVIDELLDELNGAKYFSKIDPRSGYFQIRMKVENVSKNAFQTHNGHYEFLVMHFGLCSAHATFQSLMNQIFNEHLRKFILVFFDDILVYSKTWEGHLWHLRMVLNLLRKHHLYAKRTKCHFGQLKVEYLGYIISYEGVSTDP